MAVSSIRDKSGSFTSLLEDSVRNQWSDERRAFAAEVADFVSSEHEALRTGWFNSLTQCRVVAPDSRIRTKRAASSGEQFAIKTLNGFSGSSSTRNPRHKIVSDSACIVLSRNVQAAPRCNALVVLSGALHTRAVLPSPSFDPQSGRRFRKDLAQLV
jgi:hypothetical protein